jgi:hypothetical protein
VFFLNRFCPPSNDVTTTLKTGQWAKPGQGPWWFLVGYKKLVAIAKAGVWEFETVFYPIDF